MEIFKLFGSILVDNKDANNNIEDTDKKAQGVGGTLLKGIGTAAKWGAGIATAAASGVTALAGLVIKTADAAGEIDDAAQRAGVTAEEFQKFAYAAKLSGLESSALEKAMVKQQKAFADAREGSKTASEAYQRLGIDINNIGSSSEAFDAVITKLADMEDETTRNALANDIFGKSYADLAPLLNQGSEGIAALKNEAVELGAVMSNDAVAAGANLGDTIDKLKAGFGGLVNQLGVALMPILQSVLDTIIDNMPVIQSMIQSITPIISTMFSKLLPPLFEMVQKIMPVVLDLIKQLLPPITEIMEMILPIIIDLLTTLLPPLIKIVSVLLPPAVEIIKLLLDAILPIISSLTELIEGVLTPLIPVIEKVAKVIADRFGATMKNLEPIINNVKNILKGLTDFISGVFTGNWKKAFEGLGTIVKNVFGAIVNAVKLPINEIIRGINKFIDGINKVKVPDWVPKVGGKGINIEHIPLLANGGNIVETGHAIVGEAGPELLELPKGAKVTPLAKEAASINIENMNVQDGTDLVRKANTELEFVRLRGVFA